MLSGCPDCGGNKFQFKPQEPSQTETVEPASQSSGADTQSSAVDAGQTTDTTRSTTESQQTESQHNVDTSGDAASDAPETELEPDVAERDLGSDDTNIDSEPAPERSIPEKSPSEKSAPTPSPDRSVSADRSTESDQGPPADSAGMEQTDERPEEIDERGEENRAQASARSDVVTPEELDAASRDSNRSGDTPVPDHEGSQQTPADGPRPDIDDLRSELNEQFESIRIVSPGQYELNLMELYDRQEYIISLQEDGRYVIEMPDAWGAGDE